MDEDSHQNCTQKKSEQTRTNFIMNATQSDENHKRSSCSICGKTFSSNSTLNRHMKQHRGVKPYVCSFNCGKTFSTLYNCKRHEMQHTMEAPFRCDVEGCFRCFKSLSALNYHRKTHSKEKPFVCSVEDCHKAFAFQSRSNLVKHMLTHSTVCSFFCPFCQHQYKRKSDMERHVRKKHQPVSDVSPNKDEQLSSLVDQNRKQAEIIGFLLERNKQLQDRLNSSSNSIS